jgi:hypothetical protein
MTARQVLEALNLPAEARIDHRVTKKLLMERSRGSAPQRRSLQEGIEELLWVASLKPNTIGLAAYRDDLREYLEIAILSLRVRPNAKSGRISELIHRSIPYPVSLIMEEPERVGLSLAHKRWSEAEHGETIAEEFHQTMLSSENSPATEFFLRSLDLAAVLISGAGIADMRALYQAWIDRVTAHNASSIAGTYTVPTTPEDGITLRNALQTYAVLDREIAALRSQAHKEVQLGRRVDLNLAIRRIEAEMARLKMSLEQKEGR